MLTLLRALRCLAVAWLLATGGRLNEARAQSATPALTGTATGSVVGTVAPDASAPCLDSLRAYAAKLRIPRKETEAAATLAEFATSFAAFPASVRASTIQQFLAAGEDAPTGLEFTVGVKGTLAAAPTLRAWLLDQLGSLDPAAGVSVSRQILAAPGSVDEWAIALRDLARFDTSPAGRAMVRAKVAELLANESWRRHPSPGWLEAFDLIVWLGAFDFVPSLAEMLCNEANPAAAQAAFLTLDRLAIADAGRALAPLLAGGLLDRRPRTLAGLLTRVDPRVPAQRKMLKTFLLDPARDAEAVRQLLLGWPSASYVVSPNLVTVDRPPGREELALRDIAALAALDTWLADERFARLRPELTAARVRLAAFVQQESRQ